MRRARCSVDKRRAGEGAAANPSPALFREDGLRPTVPAARDPSERGSEVNRVLQELYIALSVAKSLQR